MLRVLDMEIAGSPDAERTATLTGFRRMRLPCSKHLGHLGGGPSLDGPQDFFGTKACLGRARVPNQWNPVTMNESNFLSIGWPH